MLMSPNQIHMTLALLPKNILKAEKYLLSLCYHPFNNSAELG